MIYALTTPSGRVFEFYIHSCARLYRDMYGGTIATVEVDDIDEFSGCDQLQLL
jgi:hypothetical protein